MTDWPNKLSVRQRGAPERAILAPSNPLDASEFILTVHPFPGMETEPRALHLCLDRSGMIELRNAIDAVLALS